MRWKFAPIVGKNEENELASQEHLKHRGESGGSWQIFLILFIPQTGSPKKK